MRILTCLAAEHSWLLVALAALICSAGAWTSIGLLQRAREREGYASKVWVFFGAVAAGATVWCTHFVAMLAFETPVPVTYEPGLTTLSLVVAVLASLLAFAIGAMRTRYAPELGGAMFGLGVVLMHYIGMAAFTTDAVIEWSTPYIVASIVWSLAVSALAFNRATATGPFWTRGGAAGVMVLAVVGLHFTGMAAMTIQPLAPLDGQSTSDTAREMLAFAVTGVALLIAKCARSPPLACAIWPRVRLTALSSSKRARSSNTMPHLKH